MHETTADRPIGDRRSDPLDRRRERTGLFHNRSELPDDQQELHSTARQALLQVVGGCGFREITLGDHIGISNRRPPLD